MRRGTWKRSLFAAVFLAFWLAGASGQAFAAEDSTDRFVDGTVINGLGVTGMTTEEAKAFIESFYQGSYTLKIRDREGKQETIHDTDIGYSLKVTGDLEAILQAENDGGRISGPDVDNRYEVEVTAEYDEKRLRAELLKLSFVKNARETKDASITPYREGMAFEIVPEVQGNDLDVEKLEAAVGGALRAGAEVLELSGTDCYKTVKVHADDPGLISLCDAMNRCADMSVTYVFGDTEEILEGSEICRWLEGADETGILVDEAQAAAYVKTLANQYDTYGMPHDFLTAQGAQVTVTGPYGWKINQAAETEALIQAIRAGENTEREPIYEKTAASRSGNDYGTTYVEVDLKNQHLYLFEDGSCILDTPFVSGNVSKGWTTPDGLYSLYYKQTDKVLRGEDYETPVKYWMPFNGGIGLHDANWRSSFGGEIYKNSGSHGCINLPPDAAAIVYEHVYRNMPVICHGSVGA